MAITPPAAAESAAADAAEVPSETSHAAAEEAGEEQEARPPRLSSSAGPVYVFYDTETTGRGRSAEIISIGWCAAMGEQSGEALCMPQGAIDPGAERVHGLSKAVLEERGAGTLRAALEAFCEAVERISCGRGVLLVAHNGRAFDDPKLRAALLKEGLRLPPCIHYMVDSLIWARAVRAKGLKNSLDALAAHYDVAHTEDRELHGAALDCRLLSRVVAHLAAEGPCPRSARTLPF